MAQKQGDDIMSKEITRRQFIKTSAAIGVGTALSGTLVPKITLGDEAIDIAVVKGQNYLRNTKKAVELLGGMEKFVPGDSKVAILANVQRNNPGTYTNPEILRAAIQMCKEAGAKEIGCISWLGEKYWDNTGLKGVIEAEGVDLVITNLKDETRFKAVPVPNGIGLKEARVMESLFDYDVLIDMPITKDHSGNKFTGTLKNLMGLNSPQSNRTFHKENWETDKSSIAHLEQSIADLNTVIHPDLCIVDATEFIVTNGPFGPGELHKPQKIIAGTDRVAIDAYCCTLWGLNANDIVAINRAYDHGIGEVDLQKVNIKEVEV
jgi:uncharacterized protein (DUF362 family)